MHFAGLSAPRTVWSFDGPRPWPEIFPTDFSSTMTAADCPLAIAGVAADPLRGVVGVRVPLAGLVLRPRRPIHAEALVSRCASVPAFVSQYRGLSRGTPCCFRYVTVESTERAVVPFKGLVTGAAMCVAFSPHIHPRLYSPTGGQFLPVYTVRSAHIFALGFLQPALTVRLSAPRYLSCYRSQGWTFSLIFPILSAMLDMVFGLVHSRSVPASSRPRPAHNKPN